MFLKVRCGIEVIHNQLTQIIGCRLHVQMIKQSPESFDVGVRCTVSDVPPDVAWNEPHLPTSQETRSIDTKVDLSIIAVDKRIREPA